MRYSWIVWSPSVRVVTSGWGVFVSVSGSGGGISSSGSVPGGRARAVDWARASKARAASMTASRVRILLSDSRVDYKLERQLGLAFGYRRLEAARMVVVEDRVDDLLRVVDHPDQLGIVHSDHAVGEELAVDPVEQPRPERRVDQDDRHAAYLVGLHQRENLHQLVEGAEAAGHHHERARELHEHHLAREEMPERVRHVLERVGRLLVRQLDVEAHARGGAFVC